MNREPEYYPHVSRRLSQVFDDIGVNERTVNVRRRTGLLSESTMTLRYEVLGGNTKCYYFGSQTEGTTTLGLNSDTDILYCHNDVNVIQDWSEWKRGKINLLMIKDDSTSPGYCRLQLLQSGIPIVREDIPDKHFEYDDERRVVMKNTFIHQHVSSVGTVRCGPAGTLEDANGDIVQAFPCRNWPSEAEAWVLRYYAKKPPTINLIRHAVQSGCLVVPTGHSSSPNERLEWRISTSMAERYLMFNMNITQIRCYVLLKVIIKTFITSNFPDTISSYHCKTVLMYLVENSQNELWHEEKLLLCVTLCLRLLHISICANNLPHYFIPGNNLMAGRFDVRKRQQLLVAFEHIICNYGRVILGIELDNVGDRLRNKCSLMVARYNYLTPDQTHYQIYSKLYYELMISTLYHVSDITKTNEVDIPIDILHIDNINCLRAYFAFGVSFTLEEIHCVPQALQYEMFRCSEEENATRSKHDFWMDWAVVDSLPYLYYLQYLTYGRLGRQIEQQRALDKLVETLITEPRLYHRETALNLLGQCMEQEGRLMDALVYYRYSMNERPTNNVARWHIAVLLGRIYNSLYITDPFTDPKQLYSANRGQMATHPDTTRSVIESDPYVQIESGNFQSASTADLISQNSPIPPATNMRPISLDIQQQRPKRIMGRCDSRKRNKDSVSTDISETGSDGKFISKCSFYIVVALALVNQHLEKGKKF